MPQSLSSVYLHLVFSTKDRVAFFHDAGLRDEVHAYLGGISKRLDCPPIIVGGVDDHIHLLARMGRGICQSDWIKEVKRVSSTWLKSRAPEMSRFSWQSGYGVFSVSPSNIGAVERYIASQEEHHRKISFMDEYRGFLRRHGVEWDERHVWD